MRWQKILLYSLAIVVSVFLFTVAIAIGSTGLSINALRRGDFQTADRFASVALPLVQGASSLTRDRSQTLVCWQTGLELVRLPPIVLALLQNGSDDYASSGRIDLAGVQALVSTLSEKLQILPSCLELGIVKRFVPPEERATLLRQLTLAQTIVRLLNSVFTTTQKWVVMFQNITELRPTGGFTGSYALVELRNRTLQLLGIEDIYDADGQVARFRDAPPGIREYTSGNNGLRLPDANWWPDFPTSAQTQLDFLANAGRENLTGLVSVNLTLLQDILRITGPLALPDYNTTLTVENAPSLLRSHAEEFFPGSREKKQLLSYVLQQLLYRVATLTGTEKQALGGVLMQAASTGEIQAFSTLPEQQTALRELSASGALDTTSNAVLALVEANVGINKANQFVTRSLSLHQDDNLLSVTLNLKNTAPTNTTSLPASQSGYTNYQRVVTSPELTNADIKVDGVSPRTTESSWTTSMGKPLTDTGFLVTLLPGQEKVITITLKRPDRTLPLLLWHQPGTGVTPLTHVDNEGKTLSTSFDRNTLLLP